MIVISIVIVVLVCVLGFVLWQNFLTKNNEKNDSNKQEVEKTVNKGSISGKVVYPSEAYPSDLKVCALNSTTKESVACDDGFSQSKTSYSVDVDPGKYVVVASTANDYKGYHDNYMKSGMKADLCKDENIAPLILDIAEGERLMGIDAGNFYSLARNC